MTTLTKILLCRLSLSVAQLVAILAIDLAIDLVWHDAPWWVFVVVGCIVGTVVPSASADRSEP